MSTPNAADSMSDDGSRCLRRTELSFYDQFHTVGGIPAFLLTPPKSEGPSYSLSDHRLSQTITVDKQLAAPLLITCCAFSEDGTRLASAHNNGTVNIWDINHGVLLASHEKVHENPICSISFHGESSDIILTSDSYGICTTLDTRHPAISNARIDSTPKWTTSDDDGVTLSVETQPSRFFNNGDVVVFPAVVEKELRVSGYDLHQSVKTLMTFLIVKTDTFSHCNCIGKMSIEVEATDVVTRMEVSPDGRGLIVGIRDKEVEKGYIVLWPDFILASTVCVHLMNGTVGNWSHDNEYVVAWTVPEETFPQNNGGCCAFVTRVSDLRDKIKESVSFRSETAVDVDLEPDSIQLTNPFDKNVLWCHMIKDADDRRRLLMCVIRTTVRLLFWDLDTRTLTHIIPTGISTNHMVLGKREYWIRCWIRHQFIKGLDPLAVTDDLRWLCAASGCSNQVIVWDAVEGVELLNMQFPEDLSTAVGSEVDLMVSRTPGKIAIIGNESVVVLCPPVAPDQSEFETDNSAGGRQMVEFEYEDVSRVLQNNIKMKFSANGTVLGLLHVHSGQMHLWSLHDNVEVMVTKDNNYTVYSGFILDFAMASDFVLSNDRSSVLVTRMTTRGMLLWDCTADGCTVVGDIAPQDPGHCKAIALVPGNESIVTCESTGNLGWHDLIDSAQQTQPRTIVADEPDDEPLLGKREYLGKMKTWIDRGTFFSSFRSSQRTAASFVLNTEDARSGTGFRFTEKGFERKDAQGEAACRFSADGTIGVLASDALTAHIWNLVTREQITVVRNNIETGIAGRIQSPRLTMNNSTTLLTQIITDEAILSSVDEVTAAAVHSQQWLGSEQNLFISENDDVFLLAGAPPGSTSGEQLMDKSVLHRRSSDRLDKIYVINARNPQETRKLVGRQLHPRQGLTMSSDGKFVACSAMGKTRLKVIVWNCYACDALLPSFHTLKLLEYTENKKQVLTHIPPLNKKFGRNFINYIHPHGASVVFDALEDVNDEMVDVCLQFAVKRNIKVSLESKGTNAVALAMKNNSPEIASKLMKYLVDRVTYDPQLSKILKECLVDLSISYPRIFYKTIHNPNLFTTITDLRLPEEMLARTKFLETTDDALCVTEEDAKRIWDRRCAGKEKDKDKPDHVTTRSLVKVFPCPFACEVGNQGLLRPMLVHGASDACFASFAVRAVVTHKWRKYAGRMFFRDFVSYASLLFSFTLYCIVLRNDKTYNVATESGDEENSGQVQVLLFICWFQALPQLLNEFRQARFYARGYKWKGIYYWLQSGWNWLEMLCYLIILVVIPLGHYWLFNKGDRTTILSAIVAFESIILWFKMLYFARPFKLTGPLVIIVSSIIRDIIPFLVLFACVMFGFTMAFYVLYRHFRHGGVHDPSSSNNDTSTDPDTDFDDIRASFGGFDRTLMTMMAYVFGDFNSDVLFDAVRPVTAILLFVLYMVIISIILLNMLIAIMSDSYNRIKSMEQTHFIRARAVAIDDMESMLPMSQKKEIESEMGKYLHVAIPKYRHNKIMQSRRRKTSQKKKKPTEDQSQHLEALMQLLTRRALNTERLAENVHDEMWADDDDVDEIVEGHDSISQDSSSDEDENDGKNQSSSSTDED